MVEGFEEWNIYGTEVSKEKRTRGRVGNYQFTPMDKEDDTRVKPINKWKHPEDAWKQIVRYLRTGSIEE